jgi:hypothetical protein
MRASRAYIGAEDRSLHLLGIKQDKWPRRYARGGKDA